jgi:hypothetical protein
VIQTTYFKKAMLTYKQLPNWLKHLIYRDWKAEYKPDFNKFQRNLLADEEQNRIYLGTYFPRSYAESYCIYSNLFQNKNYVKALGGMDSISMLTVGSGTGGDVVGFLDAVADHLQNIHRVSIKAIDGNMQSMDKLCTLIKRPELESKFESLILSPEVIPISTAADFNLLSSLIKSNYDFISTFKFINEMIDGSILDYTGYGIFCEQYSPKLTEKGILLIEDVTRKLDSGAWLPCMMNTAIRDFIKGHQEYRTIIPTPCHYLENRCDNHSCYTQLKINDGIDYSKICLRMLTNEVFAESLYPTAQLKKASYSLNPNGQNCKMIDGNVNISSFDINA